MFMCPQNELYELISVDDNDPSIIRNRESSRLEYKESFSWYDDEFKYNIAKTAASFSNAEGGYIIIGVTDKPRKIVGLKGDSFSTFDPSALTEVLCQHFSPEIPFHLFEIKIHDCNLGIIEIFKSNNKPILSLRDRQNRRQKPIIHKGIIYYRYRGQNKPIEYSEMKKIIDDKISEERNLMSLLLKKVDAVGAKNVLFLDLKNNCINSNNNDNVILIDDEAIKKLKFISDGKFVETDGEPTLKIIGNACPVSIISQEKVVEKFITFDDIIKGFLDDKQSITPFYLDAISQSPSQNIPIYFFIKKLNYSIEKTIQYLKSKNKINSGLIRRLEDNDEIFKLKIDLSVDTGKNAYLKKLDYSILIKSNDYSVDEKIKDEINYFFYAIRGLDKDQFDKRLLFNTLKRWFEESFYSQSISIKSDFRKTIAYLDLVFYRN